MRTTDSIAVCCSPDKLPDVEVIIPVKLIAALHIIDKTIAVAAIIGIANITIVTVAMLRHIIGSIEIVSVELWRATDIFYKYIQLTLKCFELIKIPNGARVRSSEADFSLLAFDIICLLIFGQLVSSSNCFEFNETFSTSRRCSLLCLFDIYFWFSFTGKLM